MAIEIARDGVWRRDGRASCTLDPGRGLERRRRRVPGAARAVRRGRHRAGAARVPRRPVRRRRRAGVGAVHGQGHVQGPDGARPGSRRSTTARCARTRFARRSGRRSSRELAALGLPVFVKPARLGSSVGIARVRRAASLAAALDGRVRPRPAGDRRGGAAGSRSSARCSATRTPIASEPGEILLAAGESGWYDYEAKYTPGGMQLMVPARISRRRVRERVRSSRSRPSCASAARASRASTSSSRASDVLVNELNTMPGFTQTSVYGALFEASGIPYSELLDRLVASGYRALRARASSPVLSAPRSRLGRQTPPGEGRCRPDGG